MPHSPPTPRPETAGGTTIGSLPFQLTRMVGRESELAAVQGLLLRPDVRMLTLVGPGGVGKTRLAVRAAEDGATAFAAVVFVDLSPLTEPALALPAIARELGVLEVGPLPLLDRLAAAVGNRRLLLVLDNLEQIVEIGPELNGLLRTCPGVTILATSRVPLRVSGEYEFPVPPLDPAEALTLFVERARAVRPSFALTESNEEAVAAVCRELDGLPLAIELAAARAKVLSPEAVLARLEHRLSLLTGGPHDAPGRQRTLRDAIAWSYDLLDADEQRLFRRLGVFAGGFDLAGAEAVAGGQRGRGTGGQKSFDLSPSVFDGIASLVDKSLVRTLEPPEGDPDAVRFTMLETVRVYAHELLTASDELPNIRDRHADWCLAFVEHAGAHLGGPAAARWADRLDTEIPNLRSTLAWLVERRRADDALRLAAAPWLFWMLRGRLGEGRAWLDTALALPGAAPAMRGRALGVAGFLASNQGDYAFTARIEEGLALARGENDPVGEAIALLALGDIACDQNDHPRAYEYLEAAVTLCDQIGDRTRATMAIFDLGAVARRAGDEDRALSCLEDAVARARAQGFGLALTFGLNVLSRVARRRGDAAAAHAMYRESLDLAWRLQHRVSIAYILLDGATLAADAGEAERAARLCGAAEALREAIGMPRDPSPAHAAGVDYDRTLADVLSRLGETRFGEAWAAGRALNLAQAVEEATRDNTTTAREPSARSTSRQAPHGLTPRELEVLALIVTGQTDREIGAALFISSRTAQVHVARILAKLEVTTRTAAAAVAVREGLVPGPASPA